MIDIQKSKHLSELEKDLTNLNNQYTAIVKKSIDAEIDKFGLEFRNFFESNGLQVNSSVRNGSPLTRIFSTQIGRIKINLECNYRDSELGYFELKWNDEAYKNFSYLIYVEVNQRLSGFGNARGSDTNENIETTKTNIDVLKTLIESANRILFTYSLVKEKDYDNKTTLTSLTKLLKETFN